MPMEARWAQWWTLVTRSNHTVKDDLRVYLHRPFGCIDLLIVDPLLVPTTDYPLDARYMGLPQLAAATSWIAALQGVNTTNLTWYISQRILSRGFTRSTTYKGRQLHIYGTSNDSE